MTHQPSDVDIAASYDAAPYESFPFKQSHPTHLYTVAKLFKGHPPPVETSRILELGCSSGGNLIPVAVQFPNATCIGIDISKTEIEMGNALIQQLGIKNIDLLPISIQEINEQHGVFDYIVCHGVFSWVDAATRNKIFEICRNRLSENGVAYISYNTLPGWNMVNSMRDLMLWHTKALDDPTQKVAQSRMILKFITDGLETDQSPYAEFLKHEIKTLTKQSDNYILHEHLSYYNAPLYFYQFMEQAKEHDLIYLADAMISTMYPGNLPKAFANELSKINNIIAVNQYMDFIRNNRFRCTLLCRSTQTLNRKLNTQDITDCYIQLRANLDVPTFTQEMLDSQDLINLTNNGITMHASTRAYKALLYILYTHRFELLHYKDIKSRLKKYVDLEDKALDQFLLEEVSLMRMLLAGLIHISYYPPQYTTIISDKPTACPLVRVQAQQQKFMTTRQHAVSLLDPFSKAVLPLLDGTCTHDQVVDILLTKVNNGELTVLDQDKKPVTNQKQKVEFITQIYHNTLNKFAASAILIS